MHTFLFNSLLFMTEYILKEQVHNKSHCLNAAIITRVQYCHNVQVYSVVAVVNTRTHVHSSFYDIITV